LVKLLTAELHPGEAEAIALALAPWPHRFTVLSEQIHDRVRAGDRRPAAREDRVSRNAGGHPGRAPAGRRCGGLARRPGPRRSGQRHQGGKPASAGAASNQRAPMLASPAAPPVLPPTGAPAQTASAVSLWPVTDAGDQPLRRASQYSDRMTTLEAALERIVAVAKPDRVILFGSAARGTAGPHSDLDFLVIKTGVTSRRRLAQAIYRALVGIRASVDVVVVTPEDVESLKDGVGTIVGPALREGREVYAA